MAHATFHMAAGMAVATSVTLIPLARAFVQARPLARPLGRMLLAAYGLGLWALAPSFLTLAGAPLTVHHAWWANVFVAHAAIADRVRGGLLLGQVGLVAIFSFHYAVLVAAVAVAQRRQRRARGA
jgi:hypothetical protein